MSPPTLQRTAGTHLWMGSLLDQHLLLQTVLSPGRGGVVWLWGHQNQPCCYSPLSKPCKELHPPRKLTPIPNLHRHAWCWPYIQISSNSRHYTVFLNGCSNIVFSLSTQLFLGLSVQSSSWPSFYPEWNKAGMVAMEGIQALFLWHPNSYTLIPQEWLNLGNPLEIYWVSPNAWQPVSKLWDLTTVYFCSMRT